jgi:isoquinoline 1-oxidoreductase alpha subunit
MASYQITVNDKKFHVEGEADVPLVWIIRDYIGLKGTKFGCGIASCGACTVHLNGNSIRSCQLRLSAVPPNAKVTTIEGIGENGAHPVQEAWVELQVPQCGYCQSGQIMSAVALLNKNNRPTDKEIDTALAGNLCRCGTYDRIRKAIRLAADKLSQK